MDKDKLIGYDPALFETFNNLQKDHKAEEAKKIDLSEQSVLTSLKQGINNTLIGTGLKAIGGVASMAEGALLETADLFIPGDKYSFWDTASGRYFEDLEKDLSYVAKNPEGYNTMSFMESIQQPEFWFNEAGDGLEFMLSAMGGGLGVTKVASKLPKLSSIFSTVDTVNKLDKYQNLMTGVAAMSAFEASFEARGLQDKIKNETYANLINQGYSKEEAEQASSEHARSASTESFVNNMQLLMLTNTLELGILTKVMKPLKYTKGERPTTILTNISQEMFEEGMQFGLEEYLSHKYLKNEKYEDSGLINSFNTLFKELPNNVEAQKAVFLGGLLGGGTALASETADFFSEFNSQLTKSKVLDYNNQDSKIKEATKFRNQWLNNTLKEYAELNNKPLLAEIADVDSISEIVYNALDNGESIDKVKDVTNRLLTQSKDTNYIDYNQNSISKDDFINHRLNIVNNANNIYRQLNLLESLGGINPKQKKQLFTEQLLDQLKFEKESKVKSKIKDLESLENKSKLQKLELKNLNASLKNIEETFNYEWIPQSKTEINKQEKKEKTQEKEVQEKREEIFDTQVKEQQDQLIQQYTNNITRVDEINPDIGQALSQLNHYKEEVNASNIIDKQFLLDEINAKIESLNLLEESKIEDVEIQLEEEFSEPMTEILSSDLVKQTKQQELNELQSDIDKVNKLEYNSDSNVLSRIQDKINQLNNEIDPVGNPEISIKKLELIDALNTLLQPTEALTVDPVKIDSEFSLPNEQLTQEFGLTNEDLFPGFKKESTPIQNRKEKILELKQSNIIEPIASMTMGNNEDYTLLSYNFTNTKGQMIGIDKGGDYTSKGYVIVDKKIQDIMREKHPQIKIYEEGVDNSDALVLITKKEYNKLSPEFVNEYYYELSIGDKNVFPESSKDNLQATLTEDSVIPFFLKPSDKPTVEISANIMKWEGENVGMKFTNYPLRLNNNTLENYNQLVELVNLATNFSKDTLNDDIEYPILSFTKEGDEFVSDDNSDVRVKLTLANGKIPGDKVDLFIRPNAIYNKTDIEVQREEADTTIDAALGFGYVKNEIQDQSITLYEDGLQDSSETLFKTNEVKEKLNHPLRNEKHQLLNGSLVLKTSSGEIVEINKPTLSQINNNPTKKNLLINRIKESLSSPQELSFLIRNILNYSPYYFNNENEFKGLIVNQNRNVTIQIPVKDDDGNIIEGAQLKDQFETLESLSTFLSEHITVDGKTYRFQSKPNKNELDKLGITEKQYEEGVKRQKNLQLALKTTEGNNVIDLESDNASDNTAEEIFNKLVEVFPGFYYSLIPSDEGSTKFYKDHLKGMVELAYQSINGTNFHDYKAVIINEKILPQEEIIEEDVNALDSLNLDNLGDLDFNTSIAKNKGETDTKYIDRVFGDILQIEVVDDIKKRVVELGNVNGNILGVLYKGAVYFNKYAGSKTQYEEAFHVGFNLFLNKEQKNKVLNSIRKDFRIYEGELSDNQKETVIEIEPGKYLINKKLSNVLGVNFSKLNMLDRSTKKVDINDGYFGLSNDVKLEEAAAKYFQELGVDYVPTTFLGKIYKYLRNLASNIKKSLGFINYQDVYLDLKYSNYKQSGLIKSNVVRTALEQSLDIAYATNTALELFSSEEKVDIDNMVKLAKKNLLKQELTNRLKSHINKKENIASFIEEYSISKLEELRLIENGAITVKHPKLKSAIQNVINNNYSPKDLFTISIGLGKKPFNTPLEILSAYSTISVFKEQLENIEQVYNILLGKVLSVKSEEIDVNDSLAIQIKDADTISLTDRLSSELSVQLGFIPKIVNSVHLKDKLGNRLYYSKNEVFYQIYEKLGNIPISLYKSLTKLDAELFIKEFDNVYDEVTGLKLNKEKFESFTGKVRIYIDPIFQYQKYIEENTEDKLQPWMSRLNSLDTQFQKQLLQQIYDRQNTNPNIMKAEPNAMKFMGLRKTNYKEVEDLGSQIEINEITDKLIEEVKTGVFGYYGNNKNILTQINKFIKKTKKGDNLVTNPRKKDLRKIVDLIRKENNEGDEFKYNLNGENRFAAVLNNMLFKIFGNDKNGLYNHLHQPVGNQLRKNDTLIKELPLVQDVLNKENTIEITTLGGINIPKISPTDRKKAKTLKAKDVMPKDFGKIEEIMAQLFPYITAKRQTRFTPAPIYIGPFADANTYYQAAYTTKPVNGNKVIDRLGKILEQEIKAKELTNRSNTISNILPIKVEDNKYKVFINGKITSYNKIEEAIKVALGDEIKNYRNILGLPSKEDQRKKENKFKLENPNSTDEQLDIELNSLFDESIIDFRDYHAELANGKMTFRQFSNLIDQYVYNYVELKSQIEAITSGYSFMYKNYDLLNNVTIKGNTYNDAKYKDNLKNNAADYQKRHKQVHAPGTFSFVNRMIKYALFKDIEVPTSLAVSTRNNLTLKQRILFDKNFYENEDAFIEQLEKGKEKNTNDLSKEDIKKLRSYFNNPQDYTDTIEFEKVFKFYANVDISLTDAGSMMLPHRYRELEKDKGTWTEEKEEIFKLAIGLTDDYLKEIGSDNVDELIEDYIKEDEDLKTFLYGNIKNAKSPDKRMGWSIPKYHVFGYEQRNVNGENIALPMQIKNSHFIMWPNLLNDNKDLRLNEKPISLQDVFDKAVIQGLDELHFDSATKVNITKDKQDLINNDDQWNVRKIHGTYYKEQTKNPSKSKVVLGSQMKKAFSVMAKEELLDEIIKNVNLKELYDKFLDQYPSKNTKDFVDYVESKVVNLEAEKISGKLRELQFKKLDTQLDSSLEDVENQIEEERKNHITKLAKGVLKNMMSTGTYDASLSEKIQSIINSGEYDLSNPLMFSLFQNQITSMFRKIAKFKVKGQALINRSGFGESLEVAFEETENGTKFKHIEAAIPLNLNVKINQAIEVYNIIKDKDGNFVKRTEEFSQDFLALNIDPELLNQVYYRIPTEDKYSILPIKVVKILPFESEAQIVLPLEATRIAGLDFDIDKMFGFEYESKTILTNQEEINEVKTLLKSYNEYFKEDENYSQYQDLLEYVKENSEIDTTEIEKVLSVIDENIEGEKSSITKLKDLYNQSTQKYEKIDSDLTTEKGLRNTLLDLYLAIAKTPTYTTSILNTNSFDVLKESAKVYGSKEAYSTSSPSFAIHANQLNKAAASAIGIAANVNGHMADTYESEIKLRDAKPIYIGKDNVEKQYTVKKGVIYSEYISKKYDIDGNLISENTSESVAASVDEVKELTLANNNLNDMSFPVYLLMLRLGYKHQDALDFLNQPIIIDMGKLFLAEQDGLTNLEQIEENSLKFTIESRISELEEELAQLNKDSENIGGLEQTIRYKENSIQFAKDSLKRINNSSSFYPIDYSSINLNSDIYEVEVSTAEGSEFKEFKAIPNLREMYNFKNRLENYKNANELEDFEKLKSDYFQGQIKVVSTFRALQKLAKDHDKLVRIKFSGGTESGIHKNIMNLDLVDQVNNNDSFSFVNLGFPDIAYTNEGVIIQSQEDSSFRSKEYLQAIIDSTNPNITFNDYGTLNFHNIRKKFNNLTEAKVKLINEGIMNYLFFQNYDNAKPEDSDFLSAYNNLKSKNYPSVNLLFNSLNINGITKKESEVITITAKGSTQSQDKINEIKSAILRLYKNDNVKKEIETFITYAIHNSSPYTVNPNSIIKFLPDELLDVNIKNTNQAFNSLMFIIQNNLSKKSWWNNEKGIVYYDSSKEKYYYNTKWKEGKKNHVEFTPPFDSRYKQNWSNNIFNDFDIEVNEDISSNVRMPIIPKTTLETKEENISNNSNNSIKKVYNKTNNIIEILEQFIDKYNLPFDFKKFKINNRYVKSGLDLFNNFLGSNPSNFTNDKDVYSDFWDGKFKVYIDKKDKNNWYIESLYLPEAFQKKGMGTDIVNIIKMLAFNSKNNKTLFLWSEQEAVSFWEKQGFKQTGESKSTTDMHYANSDLKPFIVMELQLKSNQNKGISLNTGAKQKTSSLADVKQQVENSLNIIPLSELNDNVGKLVNMKQEEFDQQVTEIFNEFSIMPQEQINVTQEQLNQISEENKEQEELQKCKTKK